ncbi:MAG: hypothetical protein PHR28_10010 [candidate division Zixibacteria bacterium]|nr:hypothetical protein [candidate division Zixibacteria bacterium]
MRHCKFMHLGGVAIILVVIMLGACQREKALDPDRQEIKTRCIELFARLKVNDFRISYENEFPYLKDRVDLSEYLSAKMFSQPAPDSLEGIQLDSIKVWGDSAYYFLQLEYVRSDSTYLTYPVRNRWYKMDERWIKPTLSTMKNQEEFEEEIRIYWEAVKEKQAEEANNRAGGQDSL